MAIMAEVEERLLHMDDFEEIITCIKSEPSTWPDDKLRGILTAAYLSSVSEEELQLANESVTTATIETMLAGAHSLDAAAEEASDAGKGGEGEDGGLATEGSTGSAGVEISDLVRAELQQLKWAEVEQEGEAAESSAGEAAAPVDLAESLSGEARHGARHSAGAPVDTGSAPAAAPDGAATGVHADDVGVDAARVEGAHRRSAESLAEQRADDAARAGGSAPVDTDKRADEAAQAGGSAPAGSIA